MISSRFILNRFEENQRLTQFQEAVVEYVPDWL